MDTPRNNPAAPRPEQLEALTGYKGWIAYDGANRPAPDQVVEVFTFLELTTGWTSRPERADWWDWSIEDVPGDILAYLPVAS